MSERIQKFRDALYTVENLLHAIDLMAETAFDGEGGTLCAFNSVVETARRHIDDASQLVDDMEREEMSA